MKEVCIWLVAIATIASGCRFAYQLRAGTIATTLSTWIIFLAATSLSLATYVTAEGFNLRAGILNCMDVVGAGMVFMATLLWGERGMRIKPFERWYLAGIVGALILWFLTGNALSANLITQTLIVIGYAPTLHNIITTKKNTESFTGWGLVFLACVIALYPAFSNGNMLAEVYAVRAVTSVLIVLSLMTYYELRNRPRTA